MTAAIPAARGRAGRTADQRTHTARIPHISAHAPKGITNVSTTPNRKLIHLSRVLEQLAHRANVALDHLSREQYALDGYAMQTNSGIGGGAGAVLVGPSAGLTSVERIADARIRIASQCDQIREDIISIESLIGSLSTVVDSSFRMRGPAMSELRLCDGTALTGADIEWTAGSREPVNGWFDPSCRDGADTSGLCPKCRIRERRWRNRNGLQPRRTNGSDE